MSSFKLIDWPAPSNIIAGYTTREKGASAGEFAAFNLALHVNDDAQTVLANRAQLDKALPGNKQWQWLEQVHGTEVVSADCSAVQIADASYSNEAGKVCAIMTADCLPILICDLQGKEVAAIHAGWRSLCYGVIENTLARFNASPSNLLVYLGPAISVKAFEVGEDVRQAFLAQAQGQASMAAFHATKQGKYHADLYQLATIRLHALGVNAIFTEDFCTYQQAERFYSFRRDGQTGRMASFIYRLP